MKRSILLISIFLNFCTYGQDAPTTDPASPTTSLVPETPADPNQEKPTKPRVNVPDESEEKEPKEIAQEIPKAIPIEEEPFIPVGGTAQLKEQADIDLFTKGKDIGHVQNNVKLKFRRLVQRTIMPTEPVPKAGAVLTFDDQLVSDSPKMSSAIEIGKDLAPLNTRAIFFANVNGVSGTNVYHIVKKKISNDAKKKLVEELFAEKKREFVSTIRSLIKLQGPADEDGNREYICEVFNHTAFHQDMSTLKKGTIRYDICIMGIDFIEVCIDEAYAAERPGWERARYFRFPFLHTPKDSATKADLNKKFTELGLISVGETQDSKDFINYSPKTAYKSLAAAKRHKRYTPKFGVYGVAEKPVALFHIKTWKKIKSGVIKAIKE